jgi:hypothetical protein
MPTRRRLKSAQGRRKTQFWTSKPVRDDVKFIQERLGLPSASEAIRAAVERTAALLRSGG